MKDGAQHAIEVLKRCIRRKAHDDTALRLEERVPCQVVSLVVGMLRAIEFDDEPRFEAGEVGDEVAQWMLATELEAQLFTPKH